MPINQVVRKAMGLANRDDRLRRRQEAEDFRRIFQPLSFFFGFFGLIAALFAVIGAMVGQGMKKDILGVGVTLMSFPPVVFFFRALRGHLKKDLYR